MNEEILDHYDDLKKRAKRLAGSNFYEDLLQLTLERAYRNIDKFKPGTNMGAWLFTIMRNIWLNELARSKRTPESVVLGDLEKKASCSSESCVDSILDINKALSELPDLKIEILLLSIEGFSYEEIGQKLNVPIGTVGSSISRSRTALYEKSH